MILTRSEVIWKGGIAQKGVPGILSHLEKVIRDTHQKQSTG